MYITEQKGKFALNETGNKILKINNPKYYYDNKEVEIEKDDFGYKNNSFNVSRKVEQVKNNLFVFMEKWQNISNDDIKIQTIFEIQTCYNVNNYLIPCVSFNGNKYGKGLEPKGIRKDGKPWVFAYDRTSIPSCTLTEGDRYSVGLFASNKNEVSLKSACSVFDEGDCWKQQIIHPLKEAPYTYSSRDEYTDEYNEYITIKKNESVEFEMLVYVGMPKWKNYGIAGLLDEYIEFVEPYRNNISIDDVWNKTISFAKGLITYCNDKKAFIIGYLPDEDDGFEYRKTNRFELAWCGQNVLLSRMLIKDYIKNNNKNNLDDAIEIVDNWVSKCNSKTGLIPVKLDDADNIDDAIIDVCNMGYGTYELIKTYLLLKKLGIDKEKYLNTAENILNFFINNYSEKEGFAKSWRLDGKCEESGGTIGAFMILPLCLMYTVLKEDKYLIYAKKAMEFYCTKDLDNFVCTAGALDTCCVDKETSFPLLASGILLYEITKEEKYLEYAKKAGYYFTSWMFHYQPIYKSDCDMLKYGIQVKGYTTVSTQHHHLDSYAAITIPYFYKLAKYSNDDKWQKRADLMWNAVIQYMSDGKNPTRGRIRPIGSQNEAYWHCRWSFVKNVDLNEFRGGMNDWLVAWPAAFRLSTIADLFYEER